MADSSFFMTSGRGLLRFYFPGQTFQNFNDFYPATQIYPFDGAFKVPFGDIDKETWRSAFAVVYAINDTNRIDDKRTPFGKQSVDCRSATQLFVFGEFVVVHRF